MPTTIFTVPSGHKYEIISAVISSSVGDPVRGFLVNCGTGNIWISQDRSATVTQLNSLLGCICLLEGDRLIVQSTTFNTNYVVTYVDVSPV